MKYLRKIAFCLGAVAALVSMTHAQNLKPQEVIAKHLDAVGKKEARDGLKTLMAVGLSEFQSKLPTIKGGGKVVVVSNADNFFFLMSLNSKEYPYEKIGFFKDKISLPFVTSGARSPLGGFIAEHEKVLSDGLFGGVLSSRWALYDPEVRKARITSGGTKKIDDRKVHVLQYFTSDGGSTEFKIRLYFDAETFNHVRSEYYHEINPSQDRFGTLGRQAGLRLVLTEDFSDFKSVDGLTLPHSQKIKFLSSSNSGVFEYMWSIRVAQFRFNQKLAPDFFTFDAQ